MKKIRIVLMALLMALALVFGLTACGSDSSSSSSSSKASRRNYDDDDEDEDSDDDDDDESSSSGSIFKNSSSKASSSNDSSSADDDESSSSSSKKESSSSSSKKASSSSSDDESSSEPDDDPTPEPTKKPKKTPTPEPTEEPDDTPEPSKDESADVKKLVDTYIKKYTSCDGAAIVDYYYANLLDKLIKQDGMTKDEFCGMFTKQLQSVFSQFEEAGVAFSIVSGEVEKIESLNKLKDVAEITSLDDLKTKIKSDYSSNGAGSAFDKKKVTEAYVVGMTMSVKAAAGSRSSDGAIYVYKYDGKWMIFDKFLN